MSHVGKIYLHICRAYTFGYGPEDPGSIMFGGGGLELFLHSFVSKLVLRSTQPPIK